jgi:DNA uptake protein ComE-like DNA-binding protein
LRAAGGYAAAVVVGFLMAGIAKKGAVSGIGATILIVTWVVGMVHAALIRKSVSRQLDLVDSPELKRAQKELDRREYGRQLMKTNPSLARQLGVGRPDVAGSDSFGLIDVNHAGRAALVMLPGVTEEQAQTIMDYRSSGGSFVSVEDLVMYLDLPPTTIGPLQDTAVFDMGTS